MKTLLYIAANDGGGSGLVVIECKSPLGHLAYVTAVSAPIETGEGVAPVISCINRKSKALLLTPEQAAALLPQVQTCYPTAKIVGA